MGDLIDRDDAIMAVKAGALSAATLYGRTDEGSTALYETVRAIKAIPSAQPELIEQGAYVRGFEQGKTQGMIDAKLQLTCNQLATDCISRQAAIDAIEITPFDDYGDYMRARELIEQLPSKQQQRIKGRWTKAYDGYDGHVKCVQCFKTYDWDTQAQYYNFCPNCGSDNRGEDDAAY